jgi:hypothetical protein
VSPRLPLQPLTADSAVLRSPLYFLLLVLLGLGAYVTLSLNLWGPLLRMASAAGQQAVEIGKERLRDFLDQAEPVVREPVVLRGRDAVERRAVDAMPEHDEA